MAVLNENADGESSVDAARRAREEHGYDPRREAQERVRAKWRRAMTKVTAMRSFQNQAPSMRRKSSRRKGSHREGGNPEDDGLALFSDD